LILSSFSGIDEAGRGSVFGPLIIVGVTLNKRIISELLKNGLKDSKLFTGSAGIKKREELALKIQNLALESKIIELSATEIDTSLKNRPIDNLNLLEARHIGELILKLTSKEIKIDTISLPRYFQKQLEKYFHRSKNQLSIKVESCNNETCKFLLKISGDTEKRIIIAKKADKIFPVVSAASCVAKYIRDSRLREIEFEWNLLPNALGHGYPNIKDQNVIKFLDKYRNDIKSHKFPFIRYSWDWNPLKEIFQPHMKSLTDYFSK
jgi:ribonuclease HII